MKFSENWLRTFVNPDVGSDQLAHMLTMAGLEVEGLEPVAPAFDGIVVAEVVSVVKHPNADRLNLCQVDVGGAAPLQIVCGASNVHTGVLVPCALVGAQLPGLAIKQAKVRGIESFGMLCSAKELGLAEESSGLLLLPSDAPVGMSIRDYLDLDDKVFTLKLTPNRGDCLNLVGLARQVAAITGASLSMPTIAPSPAGAGGSLPVTVAETRACPRYTGRVVHGVNMTAVSPGWMVRRLERSGLRSISAIVDITNYVMLELGQPLHAFDLGQIHGGIRVRYARCGEKLTLLNQQTVELASDMLVIADETRALALAGIMGGEDSAVGDATCDIFLESAFFEPDAIAGRARRLGLSTDSSYRFERGVDFAATATALERATALVLEICGGVSGEIVDVAATLPGRDAVVLRTERAKRVLGIELSSTAITSLLQRLRFEFTERNGEFSVVPPSYRFDLNIEADLIEELACLHGYDNIPALEPQSALQILPQPESVLRLDGMRQFLVARDYQEVVTYSFVDRAWEADFAGNETPVQLQNPIASQMSVMRSTLLGGLVDVLRFNLNRKHERVRIFEIGRCFSAVEGDDAQPQRLAALCYGGVRPEQWGEPLRQADFFDLKADLVALCHPAELRFVAGNHPALHPGQSAAIMFGGKTIGSIGTLHPRWQQKYDLPQTTVMFEVDLTPLMHRRVPAFREISRFPPVRRDLAVVVEETLSVQILLDGVLESLPSAVTDFMLFDVYRGKGVDLGKKSLAFKVVMQDTQKTLTEEEVEAVMAKIVAVVEQRFGGSLRA